MLNLECFKQEYFDYKIILNYKIYKKGHKYDFYKISYNYSFLHSKIEKYNIYGY